MEKGNRKKLCANEKFPLGICMQKSAAMAATTAPATASSFITEARELLHFHFWFGSLRCSFVIKKKWGGERERAKWKERREAIEHRPEYIRTHTPPRSGRRSLCSILIAFFHSLLSIGWNFRFTSLFSLAALRSSFARKILQSVKWSRYLTIWQRARCVRKAYLSYDCLQINCRETIWSGEQEKKKKMKKLKWMPMRNDINNEWRARLLHL